MEGKFRNWTMPLVTLAAALACGAANAQDNGIYIGAAVADVSSDFDLGVAAPAYRVDDDSSGFKLIGGIRPLDPIGLELNYVDLGDAKATLAAACPGGTCPASAGFDARALSVSAVGYYSLPLVDLYGRVGVARWESDRDAGLFGDDSERGTDLTYGVGAQLRFLSLALRVEYERFELDHDSVDSVSLGLTYTFF
ncbi:MAG TPA: outer membrane beta-barrel protein [Gammaproteobacteria bacterium]